MLQKSFFTKFKIDQQSAKIFIIIKNFIYIRGLSLLTKFLIFINPDKYHPNSQARQKRWCRQAAEAFKDPSKSTFSSVPIDLEKQLGDYALIRDSFVIPSATNKICLEIGSMDGKWALPICHVCSFANLCDLDKVVLPALRSRLDFNNVARDKYEFTEINGHDLHQFANSSIEFIFSIDSLVRAPKQSILSYISESYRVINKTNGLAMLHLPMDECDMSKRKGFTSISKSEYLRALEILGAAYVFRKLVNHGTILFIFPPSSTPKVLQ